MPLEVRKADAKGSVAKKKIEKNRQIPVIKQQNTLSASLIVTSIYYMASSASGQYAANSVFRLATRAGKMERYCPLGTARFVPANKISPKFKRVHESFLSLKLLSDFL